MIKQAVLNEKASIPLANVAFAIDLTILKDFTQTANILLLLFYYVFYFHSELGLGLLPRLLRVRVLAQ